MYLRGFSVACLAIGVLQIGMVVLRWLNFQGPHRLAILLEAGLMALAFLALGRIALKSERTFQRMTRIGWAVFVIATLHGAAVLILHDTSLKTINLVMISIATPLIFPRTPHFLAAFAFVFSTWLGTLPFVRPYHIEPWGVAWLTAFGLSVSIHLFLRRLFRDLERLEGRDRRLVGEKSRLVAELRIALENVNTLQGLVPICAQCKKVRNDGGYWEQVEVFINSQTGRQLTHGYCPECYFEARKELEAMKAETRVPAKE
jgi:hypothetical protein